MKKTILFFKMILVLIIPNIITADVMEISASDGDLYEIINADTLADGTQAHYYALTSTDKTYKMTGTVTAKGDLVIFGDSDDDDRPPTIQSGVLADGTTLGTLFVLAGSDAFGYFGDLYLLANATNGAASGVAIEVKGDNVDLYVEGCVFDAWHTFAIGYNGQWDSFWIHDNVFRNMVHPNQQYIGEVLRNTWPGEAYTDTVSMVGNLMIGINGYAAAPVSKWYMKYFQFDGNAVMYTFKNPFFIFNMTEGSMNDNIFYGNYAGGVDRAEDPWWDNLWFPDTSYGVIALQPLNPANAIMFDADGDTATEAGMAAIEAQRDIEISGNECYWPSGLTDFWSAYNDTATNWIRTPVWMTDRTVAMFADDAAYPHLDAMDNDDMSDPEMPSEMLNAILHGTAETGDIGLLDYFLQIRGATAASDYWGFGHTVVGTDENWMPAWPTPEMEMLDWDVGGGCDECMEISADDGDLYEIINADTLADGTQAHYYALTSTDKTYKMTGTVTAKGDLVIFGDSDDDDRPPTIQSGVLADGTTLGTLFVLAGSDAFGYFGDLYLLANATNGAASGVAIEVKGDNVDLYVEGCVFDAWHTFAIGYNGQWDSFWIHDNVFRNMVHPNQQYIGEVLRNTWPGEAYTDTVSMVGNLMIGINGYAAAPVSKWYMKYFQFDGNAVMYTFKNPFFIFNMTEGSMNDNIFYGNYAGGVDRAEDPWWDNLWFPDTSYGVIALQPLNPANAIMFDADGDTATEAGMAAIEAQRDIEISGNECYWPSGLTDFWSAYNDTATNWIRTPVWMTDRTVAMFADDAAYPHLDAMDNDDMSDPEMPSEMLNAILHGTAETGDIGLLDYFLQIRGATAASDYWGFGHTVVGTDENWMPAWPLPEMMLGDIVSVDAPKPLPEHFVLHQNYPNPFNPTTQLSFSLNQESDVTLTIYNMMGQQVKEVVSGLKPAGNYTIQWNSRDDMGRNVSSGLYLYTLNDGSRSVTKKMVLMK